MTRVLSVLLLFCIVLVACVKEEYLFDESTSTGELTPTLAIPLASAFLNMGDLESALDVDGVIQTGENGVLAFVYSETVLDYDLRELTDFPEQEKADSIQATALIASLFNNNEAGEQFSFSRTIEFPFDFDNGEELDSIRLKEASLSFAVSSTFQHDIAVDFTIPTMTLDGVSFTTSVVMPWSGGESSSVDLELDVSDHLLDFTAAGVNSLEIISDFTITHSGELTDTGDRLDYAIALGTESIEYAYGYLGQLSEIADQDTQQVDLFADVIDGRIFFADPSIELTVRNGSGIPVRLQVNNIYDADEGSASTLFGEGLDEIGLIAAAAFPGEVAVSNYRLDNTNVSPSLSDLMSGGPFELIYSAEILTNPEGFIQNWVIESSAVEVDATVTLPLHGYAEGYIFSDTIEVDLADDLSLAADSIGVISTADISSLTLRTIFDNGLPMQALAQLYFLDSLGVRIDSLFDQSVQPVLLSPGIPSEVTLNSTGPYNRELTASREVVDIVISQERLQRLIDLSADRIVIRAIATTTGASADEVIAIYPEHELKTQLSAKIETRIDLDE